jgi:hypothetical protein
MGVGIGQLFSAIVGPPTGFERWIIGALVLLMALT